MPMWLIQAIGLVAMTFNILSFQFKKQRSIIVMQFFGTIFFVIHFFMLGAMAGARLNAVATLRAIVYSNKERFKADSAFWVWAIMLLSVGCYAATFLWLGKPATPEFLLIELLPVVGTLPSTLAYRAKDSKLLRRYWLCSSPLWLAYDICSGTIGGTICEVFILCSILIAMVRIDRKSEQPAE